MLTPTFMPGAGLARPTITFLDSDVRTQTDDDHTWTSQTTGTHTGTRTVIGATYSIESNGVSAANHDAFLVNGNSALKIVEAQGTGNIETCATIWLVTFSGVTTEDVTIQQSQTVARTAYAMWELAGHGNDEETDSASDFSESLTVETISLTIGDDDIALVISTWDETSISEQSWTAGGPSPDNRVDYEDGSFYGGPSIVTGNQTCSTSGGGEDVSLAGAVWSL